MRRRNRKQDPIAISEAELVAMTHDLDDTHHDIAPVDAGQPRRVERLRRRHPERHHAARCRRRRAAGRSCSVGARCSVASRSSAAVWAAASRPRPPARRRRCPAASGQKLTGDLAVVALAASLENLAVGTYQAAHRRGDGRQARPGSPTRSSPSRMTAQSQHQDHAAAWNGVLTGAGKKAVTGVDLTVKKSVDKAFAKVKDVPGLASSRSTSRTSAAATYIAAIDVVKAPAGIKTAATHPAGRDAARGDPELPARRSTRCPTPSPRAPAPDRRATRSADPPSDLHLVASTRVVGSVSGPARPRARMGSVAERAMTRRPR